MSKVFLSYSHKEKKEGHAKERCQSNLAMVLGDLGELNEAKELLTRAYHSLQKNQEPDFPLTKIAKGNLDGLNKRSK